MDDMAYIFNGNLDCITFVTTGLNKQRFLPSKRQFLVQKRTLSCQLASFYPA